MKFNAHFEYGEDYEIVPYYGDIDIILGGVWAEDNEDWLKKQKEKAFRQEEKILIESGFLQGAKKVADESSK